MLIPCQTCGEQLDATARFCGRCGAMIIDANVGRLVGGRYILRERIGAGSLGLVYRAEQASLGRKLAIKLMPAGDAQTMERFRREGDTLCKLRSPHTATIFEVGREPDGALYIAMELPTGTLLADVFRADGALAWPRVLHILAGLCDSLAEAHALGVVHRDLRPENIMLEHRASDRDFVKVLDFGLAKLLRADLQLSPAGQTVGSVEYSSPEQLLCRPIDARSDLYALGILGHLLITGRHPFHDARSVGDLVAAHIHHVPAPPSTYRANIPTDVDAIIARCLEKDPARRFTEAEALGVMLDLVLSSLPADEGDTIPEVNSSKRS